MAFNQFNIGSFSPTTNVWDPTEITTIDFNSPAFRELLVRLYQNLNRLAIAVTAREIAFYPTMEVLTGQQFFPNPALTSQSTTFPSYRSTFRTTINFGALPNAGTKSVAHNIAITAGYTFTRIYGASSDTTNDKYIPLPYSSASGTTNIELDVDATNVNIITASNRSSFNVTYVILEYMKF